MGIGFATGTGIGAGAAGAGVGDGAGGSLGATVGAAEVVPVALAEADALPFGVALFAVGSTLAEGAPFVGPPRLSGSRLSGSLLAGGSAVTAALAVLAAGDPCRENGSSPPSSINPAPAASSRRLPTTNIGMPGVSTPLIRT